LPERSILKTNGQIVILMDFSLCPKKHFYHPVIILKKKILAGKYIFHW